MKLSKIRRTHKLVIDHQVMRHAVRLHPADDLVGFVLFVGSNFQGNRRAGIHELQGLLRIRDGFLQSRHVLQQVTIELGLIDECAQDVGLMLLLSEAGEKVFELDDLLQDGQQPPSRHIRLPALHVDFHRFDRKVGEIFAQGIFILQVPFRLALLHPEEGRLRDVDIPALKQLFHVAVQERQQQGPNVAAVHVRVGHQQNLMIPRPRDIEIVLVLLGGIFAGAADAGPEGLDERTDFIEARPLDVQDLALERQDRLKLPVAALFCGTSGGVAFHDE